MTFGRGPRSMSFNLRAAYEQDLTADTNSVCIGLHLAYIELRLAAARFFQEFPTAYISEREGMSDDDMSESVYFLMSPKGQRCLIEKAS